MAQIVEAKTFRLAAFVIAAHGFLRSRRGALSRLPGMTNCLRTWRPVPLQTPPR
jgi:hypothetical protein